MMNQGTFLNNQNVRGKADAYTDRSPRHQSHNKLEIFA